MDVKERLSLEDIQTETLLTTEHLHRYHFVARLLEGMRVLDLCCGTGYGTKIVAERAQAVLGVDIAPDAIDEAAAGASAPNVRYEVADALDFLRSDRGAEFDAIVCFEGIEHLPDSEATFAELERLHLDGTRLALSVPNSKLFEEENRFHVTDFGYDEARTAFSRFPGVTIARQYLAEGSLLDVGDGSSVAAEIVAPERLEDDAANHFIALVGFDKGGLGQVSARFKLAAAPNYNSYMRGLEAGYADLYRANLELGRERLGTADSSAAVVAARMAAADDAREAILATLEEAEEQIAQLEYQLYLTRERGSLPRYRMIDAMRDRVRGVPGLDLAVSAFGRRLHTRGRGRSR